MKVLFIGDISGRPGREVIKEVLPGIKKQNDIDFIIANMENSAGGRGVTKRIINELQGYGIDFFTSGEHVWDQKTFIDDLNYSNLPVTRPLNYDGNEHIPGSGYKIIDLGKEKIIIINLLGQTFMRESVRSPFWVFDELWAELIEKGEVTDVREDNPIVIVDFHAEATAEKISFGWYIRERADMLVGTHTHVPTADQRMMDNMAYVTDVGMCGPYEASLWVDFENVIHNFRFPFKKPFQMQMDGQRVFNSVLLECENGVAKSIKRIDRVV